MPPEGVPLQPDARLLRTDELLHLCRVFSSLGVTKFRLTGGEPTLRKDLPDVVAGIKSLDPDLIGMTSNGIKIPTLLPDLVDAGLDSLNLSLDTLRPERFAQMTRRPAANLRRVLQALEMAHDDYAAPSYLAPARRRRPFTVKLNCVVMRGLNDDEVHDFVRLVDRYPHLQVRFIEYMPFDANGWQTSLLVPYRELLDSLKGVGLGLRPEPSDDPSDTTKWFSLEPPRGGEGAKMRRQVGFITSMSSHFCDSCNRLRLTADGQLKSCLFDGGEISLRDVLRRSGGSNGWSMRDLCKLIYYGSVLPKKRALGGHESPQDIQDGAKRNRPMTLIGG
jgi:cyclic pyranopterin phosphate synthase